MKQAKNIKELLDFAHNKYKAKNAINIDKEYRKDINFFYYRFDIYSLARAIKNKIKTDKVAIITENRYEFLVTYLANLILNNKIIIIDDKMNLKETNKILKKYNVNTIFFSNKHKDKILEIHKNNKNSKNFNLINFDSNNKFPIIEYEKLMNLGRYIENYTIENMPPPDEKINNIIIVNSDGAKEYSEEDFIKSAYIVGKNINIRKRKEIIAEESMNTFYKILIKVVMPLLYGQSIQFSEKECKGKYNIKIVEESSNKITIKYKNKKYLIANINDQTYVAKVEDYLLNYRFNKEKPNFILIKSNKKERIGTKAVY